MDAKILDANLHIRRRQLAQQTVERYVVSLGVHAKLRGAHRRRPWLEYVQKSLLDMCVREGISWNDLVYYLVVERRIEVEKLIHDIRQRSLVAERDFLICCESMRIAYTVNR